MSLAEHREIGSSEAPSGVIRAPLCLRLLCLLLGPLLLHSCTGLPEDPLRPLTEEERELLIRISRSQPEPASHVARAEALLAVAESQSYTEAAKAAADIETLSDEIRVTAGL